MGTISKKKHTGAVQSNNKNYNTNHKYIKVNTNNIGNINNNEISINTITFIKEGMSRTNKANHNSGNHGDNVFDPSKERVQVVVNNDTNTNAAGINTINPFKEEVDKKEPTDAVQSNNNNDNNKSINTTYPSKEGAGEKGH